MADDNKRIIISDDRLWKSIARDTYSGAVLLALVLLGWWIGSAALQWIGGIVWILFLFGRAANTFQKYRFTITEARDELDRLEQEAD